MALFVPAGGLPLQYAGQQTPADVAAAAAAAAAGQAQMPGIVPILPIMMPPILPPTLAGAGMHGMPGGAGMPADAAQQAAAAAAAAAAAVAMVAPHAPILTPQAAPMPGGSQALQQVRLCGAGQGWAGAGMSWGRRWGRGVVWASGAGYIARWCARWVPTCLCDCVCGGLQRCTQDAVLCQAHRQPAEGRSSLVCTCSCSCLRGMPRAQHKHSGLRAICAACVR